MCIYVFITTIIQDAWDLNYLVDFLASVEVDEGPLMPEILSKQKADWSGPELVPEVLQEPATQPPCIIFCKPL